MSATASTPTWRPMRPADLPAVVALATRIHPDYPEEPSVLAGKLQLFPSGCLALADRGTVAGYCYSHPWTRGSAPALNTALWLPPEPTTYLIHDVALHPDRRGQGLAGAVVPVLRDLSRAMGVLHMSLVAVHGTQGFWRRFGFTLAPDAALQVAVRAAYGAEARPMEMVLTPDR